jgi:hypothetical protein
MREEEPPAVVIDPFKPVKLSQHYKNPEDYLLDGNRCIENLQTQLPEYVNDNLPFYREKVQMKHNFLKE